MQHNIKVCNIEIPGSGLPEKYDGGWGVGCPKVELNPKLKRLHPKAIHTFNKMISLNFWTPPPLIFLGVPTLGYKFNI